MSFSLYFVGMVVLGLGCFIQLLYIAHKHRRTIRRWIVGAGNGQQQQQQDIQLVEYDLEGFMEAHPPRQTVHSEAGPAAANPLLSAVISDEEFLAIEIVNSQVS
jgi:hypothetical protein